MLTLAVLLYGYDCHSVKRSVIGGDVQTNDDRNANYSNANTNYLKTNTMINFISGDTLLPLRLR